MKPTKEQKKHARKLHPPEDIYQELGVKFSTIKRFDQKIPGWHIVRRTKAKHKNQKLFFTYIKSSSQTIQDWKDYAKNELNNIIIHSQQVSLSTYEEWDDPAKWKYVMVFLTNNPFDEEFEDWEITKASYMPAKDTWITVYRSKEPLWNELIDTVRSDQELNKLVEQMIPDIRSERDIFQIAKDIEYNKQNKRRDKITVKLGGGITKTKYEYPTNCINKKDRQRYRASQRRKNNGK